MMLRDALEQALSPLRAVRLEFTLQAERDCLLPMYLGRTLQGALKTRTRQLFCSERTACSECLLGWCCPYGFLFETPRPRAASLLKSQAYLPHPLAIEPPLLRDWPWEAGEPLVFRVLLVGQAVAHLPYLLASARELFLRGPAGQGSVFTLRDARVAGGPADGTSLWQPGEHGPVVVPRAVPVLELISASAAATASVGGALLQVFTPLQLVEQQQLQPLTLRGLVKSLLTRVSSLLAFHCEASLELDFRSLLEEAGGLGPVVAQLETLPLRGWSNRQRDWVPLDGPVGLIGWQGDLVDQLWPLLAAGEVLHAGKKTVYGLGRYLLQALPGEDDD